MGGGTETKYVSTDKSPLLSSLKHQVADLKEELDIGKVGSVSYEVDLDLQQLLAEIKDEDKENIFAEQIDDGVMDIMVSSHCHRNADVICTKDEEDIYVALEA